MCTVTLSITAWPRSQARLDYLDRVLASFDRWLQPSTTLVRKIIWAESESVIPVCKAAVDAKAGSGFDIHWRSSHANLGESLNELFSSVDSSHVLYVQDDFELVKPLNLDHDLAVMTASKLDCIRYNWQPQRMPQTRTWIAPERFLVPSTADLYSDNPFLAKTAWLVYSLGPQPFDSGPGRELLLSDRARKLGSIVAAANCQLFEHVGIESTIPRALKQRSKLAYRNRPH